MNFTTPWLRVIPGMFLLSILRGSVFSSFNILSAEAVPLFVRSWFISLYIRLECRPLLLKFAEWGSDFIARFRRSVLAKFNLAFKGGASLPYLKMRMFILSWRCSYFFIFDSAMLVRTHCGQIVTYTCWTWFGFCASRPRISCKVTTLRVQSERMHRIWFSTHLLPNRWPLPDFVSID